MFAILAAQGGFYIYAVWLIGRKRGATADSYLTGGRDIGHGMINASIVATWIWAATLMISAWTGYQYGFIGPWWYAFGAVIPLPIMAYLGRQIKRVMPNVRSYPEFMRFRLDRKNHLLHSLIAIIVSFWVVLMIVTGGSVMGVAFTGAPFWAIAVCMVIIFVSYSSIAGLWANIFADTIMTMIMYACLIFVSVGVLVVVGPTAIYEGVMNIIETKPVLQPALDEAGRASQYDGLNWLNTAALGFLVVNTIGNLGAVLCNQTYWGRVIAAENPKIVFKSFFTAAFCWWPIPLATGTALGVGALALGLTVGETYYFGDIPILFSEAEAVAPTMVFLTLGYAGLACFVIAVGGATVSTGAGEILAVVTVAVNDLIKGYIKKDATDKQILLASRIGLFVTAGLVVAVVIFWRVIGFSFAGMYQAMGIAFSSAVIPLIMAAFWTKTNREGVFWGTIIGSITGLSYWVHTDMDLLEGVVISNIIVMLVSALIAIPWTLIKPQPFLYGDLKDSGFKLDGSDTAVPARADD
jgi:urea-proton symporter